MSQLSTNAGGMLALCVSPVLEIISCWKGIAMRRQIANHHRKARHGRTAQRVKPTRGRKRARVSKPAMHVARIANIAATERQGLEPNAYTSLAEVIVE